MGRLLLRSLWDSRNPPAIPHHDERQSREYPHLSASARPSRLGDWPRSGADGGISTLSRCHAGPTPAKMRFSCDSPLEGAVRSEPVSEGENSLLARKIQGNTSILAIHPPNSRRKQDVDQCLTVQIPYTMEQGINSAAAAN